jgi:hypothetical protein
MDTNNASVRVSRGAAARVAAITVVGFLAVAGFATGVPGAGAVLSTTADIVSVDRAHKSNRLSPRHTSTLLPAAVTTLSRPPIGCESAFSRVADPKRSHVFGRCIS